MLEDIALHKRAHKQILGEKRSPEEAEKSLKRPRTIFNYINVDHCNKLQLFCAEAKHCAKIFEIMLLVGE